MSDNATLVVLVLGVGVLIWAVKGSDSKSTGPASQLKDTSDLIGSIGQAVPGLANAAKTIKETFFNSSGVIQPADAPSVA